MKNLKKIFITLSFLGLPFSAFAAPTSWDFASGVLQPLTSQRTAEVRADHYVATSTATSTLPALESNIYDSLIICIAGDCKSAWPTSSAVWGSITGTLSSQTDLQNALDAKQDTLVSGTNIKTINGNTVLGSGDLTISGSGGSGNVATSTGETAGYLSYWTSTNGTPATLGKVATSSLTATGLLSLSQPIFGIGSANSVLTLPVTKGYFVVGNDAGIAQATSSIFVSSTGNVGIGTTSPQGKLDIATDAAGYEIYFSGANNPNIYAPNADMYILAGSNRALRFGSNGTNDQLILTSGNVGIGTTAPAYKLDVYGSQSLRSGSVLYLWNTDNTSAGAIMNSAASGSQNLQFLTGGGAPLMTIMSSGNVGIGTTTPNFKLVSTNSTGPQLSLSAGAGVNQWVMRNEGGELAFATSTYTATSSVSALRIDSNGKVRANCFTTDGMNCITGTGATVAGSDTQVQFNDAGSFGGDAGLVFNKTNDTLTTLNASTTRLLASEYATIGTTTRHSTLTIQADINDGTALKMFESPGGTYNGYWSWIFGGDGDFGLQLVDAQASEPSNIFNIRNTNDSYTPFKIGFREKYVGLNNDLFTSYQPSGRSGFGTTTPTNVLTLATTTAPQLSLSSGAGVSQWTMRNAGGNLYIATTSVAGTATSTTAAIRVDTNGAVYLNNLRASTAGNAICYLAGNELVVSGGTTCATSALKGKTDIEDITKEQALGILDMKPVEYTLKENGQRRYGFIADWIKDEKLVEYTPEGEVNGFDYLRYTALLTKLVQEQQKQIDNMVVGVVDTAQEKWQWGAIIALFGLIVYQQIQIKKLKR